jgi:hypothetical protein
MVYGSVAAIAVAQQPSRRSMAGRSQGVQGRSRSSRGALHSTSRGQRSGERDEGRGGRDPGARRRRSSPGCREAVSAISNAQTGTLTMSQVPRPIQFGRRATVGADDRDHVDRGVTAPTATAGSPGSASIRSPAATSGAGTARASCSARACASGPTQRATRRRGTQLMGTPCPPPARALDDIRRASVPDWDALRSQSRISLEEAWRRNAPSASPAS